MQSLLTLHVQASPLVSVRAWHNQRAEHFGGSSAHSTIEISWADEGGPEYAVAGERVRMVPGQVVIVPAKVEHYTRIAPGVRAHVLGLTAGVVEEAADAMNLRPPLKPLIASVEPRLLTLGRLMFDEAVGQTPGHELALDALTEALAVELVRAEPPRTSSETRPTDPRIRRAVAFVDESYAGPVSLEAMAKVAAMSRFHFGRLFLAQVGKSPYRYLVDVRLGHAATLLRSGRVSVTEAALSVGFNDLSRFGRAFRARFGVTPREALAANRTRRSFTSVAGGVPA